jgi:RHS repeat-associated protein
MSPTTGYPTASAVINTALAAWVAAGCSAPAPLIEGGPLAYIVYPSGTPGIAAIQVQAFCNNDGGHLPTSNGTCNFVDRLNVEREAGCETACKRGNPITPSSGNKFLMEEDYTGSGVFPLRFSRAYNSVPTRPSPMGANWAHTYHRFVAFDPAIPSIVGAFRQSGRALAFRSTDGMNYTADLDVADRIEQLRSGTQVTGWRFTSSRADEVEEYDAAGRLLFVQNRAGVKHTLHYSDGSSTPPTGGVIEGTSTPLPAGLLIRVEDDFGRALTLGYDAKSRVARMTDPDSRNFVYAYDPNGALTTVTFPDTKVRTYRYNESGLVPAGANFPFALTGIEDENGDRFASFAYDSARRAIVTKHHAGAQEVNRYQFSYQSSFGTSSATEVDPLGAQRVFSYVFPHGASQNTALTGAVCPTCGPTARSFDADGNVASTLDWNGNRSCYKHDLARNLELVRGEGLTGSCPADLSTWAPSASTVQRKITTEWHATWRLPTKICEPKRITTLGYDTKGSMTTRSVHATNDASGALGCSAAPVGTARTWDYTYAYGTANPAVTTQILVNGPRTDVTDTTTYAYEEATGNLLSITNALGHQTTLGNYDAHGKPRQITDSNGLVTTLVWDERQRLTSRTAGSELTSYAYDGVGQLTRITMPDASFLEYDYDTAHRLTEVRDNLGNKMTYTLDAMGNRTLEETRDPGGVLRATRSREYSNLNRLIKDIGGTNPTLQITQYGYDNQGNLTSIDGPLTGAPNDLSVLTYDAVNRLKDVTDPLSGVTRYAYDGLDQLATVTDPRNNATGYTLDGLGNLSQQSSPDTGTVANTHDAAGNLLSSTDAKGQTTSYTYDALNRLTRVVYNQATGTQLKQVDYAYDQGANGIGRLTSIAETSAAGAVLQTTTYSYDPHSRTVSESRVIGGQTYATAYAYDAAGRMTGMTYPSGRTTSYGFDALGRVTRIETTGAGQTEVVVQDVVYHPFGGSKAFTFGNLQIYSRSFDLDGRIATHTLGDQTKVLSFDAASRITGLAQQGNPANANTYGYDALDRLTSAVLPTSTYGFGYDPVGNRLSRTIGGSTDTYTYGPTSNRLAVISGSSGNRTYVHDANGSITGDGVNTFGYDARGRLVSSVSAAGTTSYQVNALGQRVRKTSSLGDTVFHYDTQGRLIAESTAAGALLREYIWLGDQPVAVFVPQLGQGVEVVVDNTDAGFSATGTWPVSTAVSGYLGANYQTHEANGAPPGAVVVDNTDSGFSVTGTWPVSTAVSGFLGTNYQVHAANGEPPSAIVADNASGSATGTWPTSTSVGGYYGANYQVHAAGPGASVFTWTLGVPAAGTYQVYARWTQHPNRATNAKYTVNHSAGTTVATVNQALGGEQWSLLGTFSFGAGSTAISLSDDANGYVIADAVMLAPPGAAPNTATWTLNVPTTGNYAVYARWTEHPNRATDAKYTVNHAAGATQVTVNQQQGMGAWNLLGTFSFNAGAASVTLTDQANGYVIADAISLTPAGAAANSATWTPTVAQAGQYQVFARWTQHPNRATNATYTVTHAGGTTPVTVDQQQNGGIWNSLGTFTLSPGTAHKVTLTDQANGYVIADAVRFVPLGGQQTGTAIYYVHTDHLNAPRVLTNQAQQVVWRWENQEPFGKSLPEENPSGLGAFTFNLRFPGQYFDAETGLFYNYQRDYDPQTARYVQSDPIGLAGGINPYAYVASNPLSFADPTGLQVPIAPGIGGIGGLPGAGGPLAPGGGIKPSRPGDDPFGQSPAPGTPTWPFPSPGSEAEGGQSAGRLAPPGKCTATQHRRLQDEVDAACKIRRRCDPGQSCPELLDNYYKNIRCAQARDEINNTCFGGGDSGHRQAANDARNAAKNCVAIMQQKNCTNCPVPPNN